MNRAKGIVSKITSNNCIVLTTDGEFRRIPLPRGPIRVGQEIDCQTFDWSKYTRFALIAAALLIAILGLTQFQSPASATPVAYVSLDINPSLELAVDKNHRVISITTYNTDSENLLNNLEYKDKDIYLVVSMLLRQAVEQKYVSPDRSNLVVTTIVELDDQNVLDNNSLQIALAAPLEGKALKTEVVVIKAKKADREAAKKVKLSTGKYLFYKSGQQPGTVVSIDEIKANSLGTLVSAKKIKLPKVTNDVSVKQLNKKTADSKDDDIDQAKDNDVVKEKAKYLGQDNKSEKATSKTPQTKDQKLEQVIKNTQLESQSDEAESATSEKTKAVNPEVKRRTNQQIDINAKNKDQRQQKSKSKNN